MNIFSFTIGIFNASVIILLGILVMVAKQYLLGIGIILFSINYIILEVRLLNLEMEKRK